MNKSHLLHATALAFAALLLSGPSHAQDFPPSYGPWPMMPAMTPSPKASK